MIIPAISDFPYWDSVQKEYEIGFCSVEDIGKLQRFIDEHWRKNHIFTTSKMLLDWQHFDRKNNRYNFVLSKHCETQEIHSMLGFTPTSHYDDAIETLTIWPCLWKVREDIRVKGLGLSLYKYLDTQLDIDSIHMLGLSEVALSIYKNKFGFDTGHMHQAYMLNKSKKAFAIIDQVSQENFAVETAEETSLSLEVLTADEFLQLACIDAYIPFYKSKGYYVNRFFKHPVYTYLCCHLSDQAGYDAVFFLRTVSANGARAFRVIDYIGAAENGKNLYLPFQKMMQDHDAEYIDFCYAGLSQEFIAQLGFLESENSTISIPHYFEPFLRKSIALDYAFANNHTKKAPLLFKGDSDQDRPNMLE